MCCDRRQHKRLTVDLIEQGKKLSLRESQICELLIGGASQKIMADSLGVSSSSIHNYIQRAKIKADVKSTAQPAVWWDRLHR